MKRIFIICLMAIAISSCTTYTYTYSYKGDVVLHSNDGKILEQWDNAVFSQGDSSDYVRNHNRIYKNGGLEFLTAQGEAVYINGGIIVVRNIRANIKQNIDTIPITKEFIEENRDYK